VIASGLATRVRYRAEFVALGQRGILRLIIASTCLSKSVPELTRQRAGDLAKRQHPVQHRVTQDVFGVPALPGNGIQVTADRSRVVDQVGEVQCSRRMQNLRVGQHLVPDHPVQPVLGHEVHPMAEKAL
jgi:hypothetical protein